MEDYWKKEWEIASLGLAKANFIIGWLSSCLESAGVPKEKIKAEMAKAKEKADSYLGK